MIKRLVFESETDWLKERDKVFTASEINRLMADVERPMTKSELEEYKKLNPQSRKKNTIDPSILSDGAITYILEKIAIYYESPKPKFYSPEMEWGKENEGAAALELCEILGLNPNSNDVIYTSVNGWVFFTNDIIGGTPDLIFPNIKKSAEIKCPNSVTHLYYKAFVTAKNFQSKLPIYYDQMQTNMNFTNTESCYFMSFDPRFKDRKMTYHILEIPRNQNRIDQIMAKSNKAHQLKTDLVKQFNES
jgi:hypothetical protein